MKKKRIFRHGFVCMASGMGCVGRWRTKRSVVRLRYYEVLYTYADHTRPICCRNGMWTCEAFGAHGYHQASYTNTHSTAVCPKANELKCMNFSCISCCVLPNCLSAILIELRVNPEPNFSLESRLLVTRRGISFRSTLFKVDVLNNNSSMQRCGVRDLMPWNRHHQAGIQTFKLKPLGRVYIYPMDGWVHCDQ